MATNIGPMAYFQEQLQKGVFMIQRSRSTGKFTFYPRAVEPGTGSDELEWTRASGKGRVYASTTLYPRRKPPYNISIVELAEGPRLMTRVIDVAPEDVQIGMEVYARIERDLKEGQQGAPVLVFSVQPEARGVQS